MDGYNSFRNQHVPYKIWFFWWERALIQQGMDRKRINGEPKAPNKACTGRRGFSRQNSIILAFGLFRLGSESHPAPRPPVTQAVGLLTLIYKCFHCFFRQAQFAIEKRRTKYPYLK